MSHWKKDEYSIDRDPTNLDTNDDDFAIYCVLKYHHIDAHFTEAITPGCNFLVTWQPVCSASTTHEVHNTLPHSFSTALRWTLHCICQMLSLIIIPKTLQSWIIKLSFCILAYHSWCLVYILINKLKNNWSKLTSLLDTKLRLQRSVNDA